MYPTPWSILIFCLLPAFAVAQNAAQQPWLDSLNLYYKADTQKVIWLNNLAHSYWNAAPIKTDSLGRVALKLSEKLNYQRGKCRSHYEIAVGQWMLGNYPKAYENASEQLKIAEENGLNNEVTRAYAIMALITEDQGLVDKSLEYHRLVLQKRTELRDSFGIASTLNNLGSAYWRKNQLDTSLMLFRQSFEIRKALGSKRGMRESLSNVAYILNAQGKPDAAMPLIRETYAIAVDMNDNSGIVSVLETMGDIFQNLNELDSAEQSYLNALTLAEKIGVNKRIIGIKKQLADVYNQKGNYGKAYRYLDEHWILKDSIEGLDAASRIAQLQAQYETEKKEKEIIQLQQQNEINRMWRNIFALGSGGAFIFAILLFRFYRYRQKKNLELLEAKDLQNRQLEEVNQLKSRFLANISHDFRTPLTLILGPTETLLSSAENETQKLQLNWIQKNSRKLLKLINQLLDLSRVEAGKLPLKCSQQDLIQFSKYICSAFESQAAQKNIRLVFRSKIDQFFLYFDVEKMEQVFYNLMQNALKFTEKGMISMEIEENRSDNVSMAKITIADSGTGIHPQQLPYIFDRFYQGVQDEQKAWQGTGIGLALCKELVDLHSGRIEVESQLGKGTRFSILLPLGRKHLKEDQIIISSEPLPRQELKAHASTSENIEEASADKQLPLILLIDDNEDVLSFIQLQLRHNYRILKAQNGEEGLHIAQKELPDLIVSDVMMPKLDGFEFCARLKKDIRTDHIPIILLTARADEDYKLLGLKAQADEYLQKPFNSQELEIRIHNLIEGRKRLRKRFAEKIVFRASEIAETPQENLFLQQLTDAMEHHLSDSQFDVNVLCRIIGMSKSQLNRKMKAVVNKSPNQFIRSYRLEKARQMIKNTSHTLAEIAYDVGFSSPAYFSKCFHDEFGFPPSASR